MHASPLSPPEASSAPTLFKCWPPTTPHTHSSRLIERGEKTPTPKISALLRKQAVLLRTNFVLTKDRKRPYYGHFYGKILREGSCSKAARGPKRPGVLGKVQMLNLVLGVGVFSLLPNFEVILTTPTPHIGKKYDPKICHKMRGRMAYKSLEMKGFSQRMWCTNRLLWHTNWLLWHTKPPFYAIWTVFIGDGGVFN